MSSREARYWIEKLNLAPHPEGGYFRETYRAGLVLNALPTTFRGPRSASTAIYFLLEGTDFSAFHRIASDELWHFYDGSSLAVHIIHPDGRFETIRLGRNIEAGDVLQAAVPAGCWFASSPVNRDSFALVGCTVAPGFDYADFEMANREALAAAYPQHQSLIERYTRS